MKTTIEDLGSLACDDIWLNRRFAKDPTTGREVALAVLGGGGFMVLDPIGRRGRQVTPDRDIFGSAGWPITQGPDGLIYQMFCTCPTVFRWDWRSPNSQPICDVPTEKGSMSFIFTIDAGPDGRLYAPNYTRNILYRVNLADGTTEVIRGFEPFGAHIRTIFCAADGWVYVTATDYKQSCIVAIGPATGEKHKLGLDGGRPLPAGTSYDLIKDADGKVLISYKRWGRTFWMECRGGAASPIEAAAARLAQTQVMLGEFGATADTPWAWPDGSYISRLKRDSFTVARPGEPAEEVAFERNDPPMGLWCIEAGGGKIWCGTVFPATFFSYDPADGSVATHPSHVPDNGEIYNMVWSRGKLFLASYTRSNITRYDPSRPWKVDATPTSNPAVLGRMKDDDTGRDLHRAHGKAISPDGIVFFSSVGGYGCEDSGICRIDPGTDVLTRWVYPNTTFEAMCYLPSVGQLLVSESRKGEQGVRFTRISPDTGEVIESDIVIADKGSINSWLHDGQDLVYGYHGYRDTLLAYSISQRRIVHKLSDFHWGPHCYNMLMFGPDGRVWGLTTECVYAADRQLSHAEIICRYEDHAKGNAYRFGMVTGADGHIYFPNGSHLMRLRIEK